MFGDELAHLIKQVSSQNADVKPFVYGHIASYDPTLNRVRCVIPSMNDQDGNSQLSPWMPMLSTSTGSGYGMQYIPFGGATVDNPTAGEQVLIGIFDRQRGVSCALGMFYHGTNPPASTNLPTQQDGYQNPAAANQPGDFILSAAPAAAGGPNSFIRIRQNGNIEVWSAAQLNINTLSDTNVTVGGSLSATVAGNASATITGTADITATGNVTVTSLGEIELDAPTVNCSGTVNASGDVIAAGISLITHAHEE